MRRHRFGRLAASVAALYLAVVVVLGVVALVTGEVDLLWWVVAHDPPMEQLTALWWLVLALVLAGAVQGWAYWQVLRGRVRGEPADGGGQVALLRGALYISVAFSLIPYPFLWSWADSWMWLSLPPALVQPVIVWLFFRVLAGAIPTWSRILLLVTGMINAAVGIGLMLSYALHLDAPVRILTLVTMDGLLWLTWLVPLLVAQARDARWSRTTVWMGALTPVVSFLHPGSSLVSFSPGDVPYTLVVSSLLSAISVFGMVWEARSAHELTGPRPSPVRPRPAGVPSRRWPLPALAIALPLVPAAVNLANGMPFWIGPRGAIHGLVFEETGEAMALTWLALDLLVGVGVPALLILAAILRGTRRLMRATTQTLILLASTGVVTALTTDSAPSWDSPGGLPLYPDGLFLAGEQGELSFGLSPLWYSAALLASALILLSLYGAPPAQRVRHHVPVAALATAVVLCLLPVADQSRGPVTTAQDCEPPEAWRGLDQSERRTPTGEEAYLCGIRSGGTLKFAATTPDQVLLAHGRRLCGVYTRDDPQEVARLRAREGHDPRTLAYELAGICPSAAATVKAAQEARNRELEEWRAESRRRCDATPRHRPLIRPARRIVIKEPQRTDHGVLEAWEQTEDAYDPSSMELLDKAQDNGLVAARPGHLIVLSHSDFDLCVTVETYTRRPPVETKGWDHVVEVGYDSPTGEIVLTDDLSGTELPDLALDGREGHYRIRVHHAWFPGKSAREGAQRLLIMAYPGGGDKVATYRRPGR